MPLPHGGDLPWPPTEARAAYIRYGEHSAWYSGSPQELTRFYAGYAGQDRTGFFDPSTTAQPFVSIWRRFFFWARQQPGQIMRPRLHAPIAADMSATSADLLFSDPPRILIPQAHIAKATKKAKAIQDRLDALIDEDSIQATLHEGAEICSALGGVFLRVHWDKAFKDRPMLQAIHPDSALPTFQWGRLSSVIFWRFIEDDGHNVWRHLELHEPGTISHGLYKGSATKLGIIAPLTDMPATTPYAAFVDEQGGIQTGLKGLDCVYIPNMRPNRADRSSDLGRSDYAGSEGLMDALDETFTSWQRDLRLAKARLLVPEEFIQSQGRGKGASFDIDREIFEALKMAPSGTQPNITPQQFAIRTAEHEATATALIERIIATAGYSGSTFGLKSAATVERTATEVKAREHRSLTTRDKKIGYWSPAIADILEAMLAIDEIVFAGPGTMRPRADFPESIQDSLLDTSTSIELLTRSSAISTETKVKMAHPNWDPDEVNAEVNKIQAQTAVLAGMAAIKTGAQPEGAPPAPGSSSPMAVRTPADPGPMPPGTGGPNGPNVTPPATLPAY